MPLSTPGLGGNSVKKSIVALLVVLALIVLLSPGIIGHLAEQSVDANLDWAATESQQVVVSVERFDRGWFVSEGRHRVEIDDAQAATETFEILGLNDESDAPALLIDTRLDHGLIPVTSMSRGNGTLMPGLGSSVSTLSLDYENGTTVAIPGELHSHIGLTGSLTSRYRLQPGSLGSTSWDAGSVTMRISAAADNVSYEGLFESFTNINEQLYAAVENVAFSGDLSKSDFDFFVGDIHFSADKLKLAADGSETLTLEPVVVDAESRMNETRVDNTLNIHLGIEGPPDIGNLELHMDMALNGVDGAAMDALNRAMQSLSTNADAMQTFAETEDELKRIVAAGLEWRFDRLDLSLAQGNVESKLRVTVEESDARDFEWVNALLAVDAMADIRISAELVDLAIAATPEAATAVGMGFLKKNGDFYEMQAAYKKGLLTVNGAPMPIPLAGGR